MTEFTPTSDYGDMLRDMRSSTDVFELAEDALNHLHELRRGLLDMKRRGLLGEDHCPEDNQWIDHMLRETRRILKGRKP